MRRVLSIHTVTPFSISIYIIHIYIYNLLYSTSFSYTATNILSFKVTRGSRVILNREKVQTDGKRKPKKRNFFRVPSTSTTPPCQPRAAHSENAVAHPSHRTTRSPVGTFSAKYLAHYYYYRVIIVVRLQVDVFKPSKLFAECQL